VTDPQPDTPTTTGQAAQGADRRPQPVLNAAAVASAVTGLSGVLLTLLVAFHVLTPEGSAILGPVLASAIPTALGAAGTLAAALHARSKVTPLSAPVSAAGIVLVEAAGQVADAVRAARRPPGPQTPGVPDHAAG
jgi:hypothetical protein